MIGFHVREINVYFKSLIYPEGIAAFMEDFFLYFT